jgi:hypothetical protein
MPAASLEEPRRVFLDVNVYLDAALMLGPGGSLDHLPSQPPLAHLPTHPAAAALGVVLSGHFAGPLGIIPCISHHITDTAVHKLTDPLAEGGLGWGEEDTLTFVQAVLDEFYELGGSDVDVDGPRHSPPCDYEDGMVVAGAIASESHYLITSDGDFLQQVQGCYGLTVLTPREFLTRIDHYRSLAGG